VRVFTILGGLFTVIGVGLFLLSFASFASGTGIPGDGGLGLMITAWTFLPIGIVFLAVGIGVERMLGTRRRLLQTGTLSTATLQAVRETSMRVNGSPVVQLELVVDVPGRGPVRATMREVVPLTRLAALSPGTRIPVAVDRLDPSRMAIDWERVGEAGPDHDHAAGLPEIPGFDLGQVTDQLQRMGIALDPRLFAGLSEVITTPGSGTPAVGARIVDVTPGGVTVTVDGSVVTMGGATTTSGAADPDGHDAAGTIDGAVVAPSSLLGTSAVGAAGGRSTADTSVDVTGETLSALRAAGVPARGVLREVTDMGISIGDGRLFRMRLHVIADGRPGTQVEHVALVPGSSRWRMVTGVTLPLFIDRTDPARLAVDWSG
jgi:hypothetical protein